MGDLKIYLDLYLQLFDIFHKVLGLVLLMHCMDQVFLIKTFSRKSLSVVKKKWNEEAKHTFYDFRHRQ